MFIPHLVVLMHSLQKWTGKKDVWQWIKQQEAFDACKNALIEHAQLYTPRQGNPFELEVTILDDSLVGAVADSWAKKSERTHRI